jgi:hypothetical protein
LKSTGNEEILIEIGLQPQRRDGKLCALGTSWIVDRSDEPSPRVQKAKVPNLGGHIDP